MEKLWATTVDNPWDYFSNFDEWYATDRQLGYNTCSYIARLLDMYGYSDEMSEEDKTIMINDAVRRVIRDDLLDRYRVVREKDPAPGQKQLLPA